MFIYFIDRKLVEKLMMFFEIITKFEINFFDIIFIYIITKKTGVTNEMWEAQTYEWKILY